MTQTQTVTVLEPGGHSWEVEVALDATGPIMSPASDAALRRIKAAVAEALGNIHPEFYDSDWREGEPLPRVALHLHPDDEVDPCGWTYGQYKFVVGKNLYDS